MRTTDMDFGYYMYKVKKLLREKGTWTQLTRLQLSEKFHIPLGYRMNKLVDMLRYEPNIACKYGRMDPGIKSKGHAPLLYRYVDSEDEKYKLSFTPEAVAFMTPEQYLIYEPTLKKLFPDKKDRFMALRFLDLLYCQHYDTEWKEIKLQKFAVNLAATPRTKMREFIQKFTVANILLVSPDCMYRLASTDKKENKKNMLDKMRDISEQTPKLNETEPGNLEFRYLSGLNNITKEVARLQEFNTDITKSLSDIVLALNQLQQTDHVIKNSDVTFIRLNDMYRELREEYSHHIETERKLFELIGSLDDEPLTGTAMRILSEMKRILDKIMKETNQC